MAVVFFLELTGEVLYSSSQFTCVWGFFNNIKCWVFKEHNSNSLIIKKYLYLLQDWGKPGDLWNLDIQWHVPSSEEISFAFYLLDTFLQPELTRLELYTLGELEMSR